MILLLLASVYCSLRYEEQPVWRQLIIAAVISGLAILIKPVSLFVIYSAFVALVLMRKGIRSLMIDPHLLAFFLISLFPALLFYLYGIFIGGFLKAQAESSILPQIILTPFFWRGWLHNIRLVVGFSALVGSLFGVLIVRPNRSRYFLLALWIGYMLFCLTFAYHIATHDYYHLQLIPIVALSLGPVFSLVFHRVLEINQKWYERMAVWSLTLIAFILLTSDVLVNPLDRTLETKVRQAEIIGERVNHDTNTIFLSSDYGLSLEYHGQLSGLPWPLASDLEWERLAGVPVLNAEKRFQTWFVQTSPSYFIVLDLREYAQQTDLKELLTKNYPVLAQSDDYIIFDLRQKQ
jgi:hypothetical protein